MKWFVEKLWILVFQMKDDERIEVFPSDLLFVFPFLTQWNYIFQGSELASAPSPWPLGEGWFAL